MTIARAYSRSMSDPTDYLVSQSAIGEAEWRRRPATGDGTTHSSLDPGMFNREARARVRPGTNHPISGWWLVAFVVSMSLIMTYLLV